MLENQKYIIREPFTGGIVSSAYPDIAGNYRISYSGSLQGLSEDVFLFSYLDTLKYNEPEATFKVVTDDELTALLDNHYKTLETLPAEISLERFTEMLEILPPSRWKILAGFEVFHCSEGLTGDLVAWFARRYSDNKCFELTQSRYLKNETLINLLNEITE